MSALEKVVQIDLATPSFTAGAVLRVRPSIAKFSMVNRAVDVRTSPKVTADKSSDEQPDMILQPGTIAIAQLRPKLIRHLAAIQLADLVTAPEIEEVTTASSTLHVHFEYCLLTITRRLAGVSWWHATLLQDESWCVPGMRRGQMIPASEQSEVVVCLPQALLAVRNVTFTGSWTAAAQQSLKEKVSFLGPFLIAGNSTTMSSAGQMSVLGSGIQIIGELCMPLAPLPPRDAAATSPAA